VCSAAAWEQGGQRRRCGCGGSAGSSGGVQLPPAGHAFECVGAPGENEMPAPATRSVTVRETSTSPGPARSATRAAMCTARPPMSPSRHLTSPVCPPARIRKPNSCIARQSPGPTAPASGTVEHDQHPVAGRLDAFTPVPRQQPLDDFVVTVQRPTPLFVADGGRLCRRLDDVGAHDREQYPVGHAGRRYAGDELLDQVEHRIGIGPQQMVLAGQLDQARIGNLTGHPPCPTDVGAAVTGPVDQQRRHPQCGQHCPDVAVTGHAGHRRGGSPTRRGWRRVRGRG
jgi:hypothetical protein